MFKSGNYGSSVKGVVSHAVFSLWIFGNYLLFYLNHESYMKTREEMVGKEYVDKLNALLPMWSWVSLLAATLIFGLIGGLIGKAMLKKHLSKAGIA
jgi:energy-coupling factor transport system substrate-specific component